MRIVTHAKKLAVVVAMLATSCDRTAHQFARSASALAIPASASVVSFEDQPSGLLGEDLFARAEFQLSAAELEPLVQQAHNLGYTFVDTSKEPAVDVAKRVGVGQSGLSQIAAQLRFGCKGLFRYRSEGPADYSVVVLDVTHRRIVVEVLIL